ncbi:hypothetical protein ABTW96_34535 [Nocardia beijingensis]|uniref:hypothetical protein n=1 Tax=Nocardia beijingensis TaxID=95162 RepID=UPI00331E608D
MGGEALVLGHGGVRAVARVGRSQLNHGPQSVFEVEVSENRLPAAGGRVRRVGGGRRRGEELDLRPVAALVEPESSKGQLLQAKTTLQRMLVSIPLADDEQAAVKDGQAALDRLLQRLADVSTPAGATPREADPLLTTTQLPIVTVIHG